jgi:hypothetical protein
MVKVILKLFAFLFIFIILNDNGYANTRNSQSNTVVCYPPCCEKCIERSGASTNKYKCETVSAYAVIRIECICSFQDQETQGEMMQIWPVAYITAGPFSGCLVYTETGGEIQCSGDGYNSIKELVDANCCVEDYGNNYPSCDWMHSEHNWISCTKNYEIYLYTRGL